MDRVPDARPAIPAIPLQAPRLPMRCRRCSYVLEHLETDRCPECGTPFDPTDPATYDTRPPFVRWRYWLPGVALTVAIGVMLYVGLEAVYGYGVAVTVVLPTCLGAILGYGLPVRGWMRILWAIPALGAIVLILWGIGTAASSGDWRSGAVVIGTGTFCGLVLFAVALVPILVGTIVGILLQARLKKSRWDQRHYLPIVLLALIPVLAAAAEGRCDALKIVSLDTVAIIDAPPDKAWEAIQFYAEVKHAPPLLLRLSPSLRPVRTAGHSEKVGDVKICYYERGKLTKRITEVIPGKRLAFAVVGQAHIENESVQLVGGSFELEPIDGGRRTRVRLSTTYRPLLAPRFAWQPAEALAVHTLHGHVLEGMRREAEAGGVPK